MAQVMTPMTIFRLLKLTFSTYPLPSITCTCNRIHELYVMSNDNSIHKFQHYEHSLGHNINNKCQPSQEKLTTILCRQENCLGFKYICSKSLAHAAHFWDRPNKPKIWQEEIGRCHLKPYNRCTKSWRNVISNSDVIIFASSLRSYTLRDRDWQTHKTGSCTLVVNEKQ